MQLQQNSYSYYAGVVCIIGIIIRILLCDPLLLALGYHYTGETGNFYEKIHPGSLLIFAAFIIFLLQHYNPLLTLIRMYQQQTAFSALLFINCMLFIYMGIRSGFSGLAFMLDTHCTAVISAIILSHAPAKLCRITVSVIIGLALVNALTGIVEAYYKLRLFTFPEDWAVLHETHFRASALMGHPLDNAMFTALALLTIFTLQLNNALRIVLSACLVTGLLAFGGRAALLFSLLSLIVLGGLHFFNLIYKKDIHSKTLLPNSIAFLILCTMTVLLLIFLVEKGLGERLISSSYWDNSADARLIAFRVFDYMSSEELLFGVSGKRIMAIVEHANEHYVLSDIENPWIMMIMYFGIILFTFWCAAFIACMVSLVRNQSSAIKIMVFGYFIIASTANAFGRKDVNLTIMVALAVCCRNRLIKHFHKI